MLDYVVHIGLLLFWAVGIIMNLGKKHSTHRRVIMESTMAYSMMALKILKMHVTMKLSIAFKRLEAAAGALALI